VKGKNIIKSGGLGMKKMLCVVLFFVIFIFSTSCFAEEGDQKKSFVSVGKKEDPSVCRVVYRCKYTGVERRTLPMIPVLAERYKEDKIRTGQDINAKVFCK
jgi:hypothetical protein